MPEADGGTATSEGVAGALRQRIRGDGPLSFAAFMEAALYDPDDGYYAAGRSLGAADFRTSPQVHPAFAALLAAQVAEMCRLLGSPHGFRCVELGPGDGTLAAGLVRHLDRLLAGGPAGWELHLVEASEVLRRAQRRRLEALPERLRKRIAWSRPEDLGAAPADGVVVSNEFFDALPVHRVLVAGGELRELRVAWDAARGFHEVVGDAAPAALGDYLERYGVALGEGQRAEICLGALGWIDRAAAMLRRGYLLTIDYGHPAGRLYGAERAAGTLAAYLGHRVVDPFAGAGDRDLTAHVNFTALERRAGEHGFRAGPLRTQTEFLLALGVLDHLGTPEDPGAWEAQRLEERFALKELFVPGGMGETFRVQILARDAGLDLTGLRRPWRAALDRERRES